MRPSTPGRTSLIRSERASMSKRQGCAPVHRRSPEPWMRPPSASPSKRSSANPSRSTVAPAAKLTGGSAAPLNSARAETRYGSGTVDLVDAQRTGNGGLRVAGQWPAQVLPFAAERERRQRAFRGIRGRQGDGAARRQFQSRRAAATRAKWRCRSARSSPAAAPCSRTCCSAAPGEVSVPSKPSDRAPAASAIVPVSLGKRPARHPWRTVEVGEAEGAPGARAHRSGRAGCR